ncbi:MAG: thiamine-binding protein [Bacteroidetes bacterium]|nr:thiamine-binding protein [Bacteroidota bacterium]
MIINVAIQLLPIKTNLDLIYVVDEAIKLIKESELKHVVCPFETVVEGESKIVYELIEKLQNFILKNYCDEIIMNLKIHASKNDLFINDKIEKYC